MACPNNVIQITASSIVYSWSCPSSKSKRKWEIINIHLLCFFLPSHTIFFSRKITKWLPYKVEDRSSKKGTKKLYMRVWWITWVWNVLDVLEFINLDSTAVCMVSIRLSWFKRLTCNQECTADLNIVGLIRRFIHKQQAIIEKKRLKGPPISYKYMRTRTLLHLILQQTVFTQTDL